MGGKNKMSLYTKDINEITFKDIEAFCNEELEEDIRLEYKREIENSKKIAKEIAAFANTYGGLLLIGVEEGDDRKPKLPLCGIDYTDGLHEKITSIAFKGIYPPVFPEIQVCKLDTDTTKAIIVVRTIESKDTPHRIDKDSKAYVRVASQSMPVLAKSDDIEFLQDRRKKAIETREWLLERAHERFAVKYNTPNPLSTWGISIVPLYPHKELIDFSKLFEILNKSRVRYEEECFPSKRTPITLQNSILYSRSMSKEHYYFEKKRHTEVNSFGLLLHKESMKDSDDNDVDSLHARESLEIIITVLSFAKRFYKALGFGGIIQIYFFCENVRGKCLVENNEYINEFDNNISLLRVTTVSELTDHFEKIIISLYREFLWSFNAEPMASNDKILQQQFEIFSRDVSDL